MAPNLATSKPAATATAEEGGKNREEATDEPTKRLILDIPESQHRAIKVFCAGRGAKMAKAIRVLLEAHYAQQ